MIQQPIVDKSILINSPSKTTNNNSVSKTTYVIANSPSKLRALAASHSTSSPNHRSGGGFGGGSLNRSPMGKSSNPFATGGSGLDDVNMMSDESDDFFRGGGDSPLKKSASKMSVDSLKGEKGKKVASTAWESVFSGDSRGRGSSMSLEGNGIEEMEVIDEGLGPSPVKLNSKGKQKKFTPLLLDSEPSTSLKTFSKSTIFESSSKAFSSSLSSSTNTSSAKPSTSKPSLHPALLAQSRGVKRPGAPLDLLLGRNFNEPNEETEPKVAGKGKGKAKIVSSATTQPRKQKRPKFTTSVTRTVDEDEDTDMEGLDQEGEGNDPEARSRRRKNGDLVLQEEEGMGRAIVQQRGARFRSKGKGRQYENHEMLRGIPDDEDDEEGGSNLNGSLFYRNTADLLSTQEQTVHTSEEDEAASEDSEQDMNQPIPSNLRQTRSQPNVEHSITLDSTIPSELVSMLSIRSSPIKKTALLRERDRDLRVKKLLQEPSVKERKVEGLLDLKVFSDEEDEIEGGSDDDWDSDAEGWKDLGNGAMDNYDDYESD